MIKKMTAVILIFGFTSMALAQTDAVTPGIAAPPAAAPAPVKKKKAPSAGDEKGVKAAFQALSDAWATGDATQAAALFTPDSSLINPFGVEAHGISEVEKVVGGDLEMMKGSQQTFSDFSIHFVLPNLALVDATGTVTGMKNPDGTDVAPHLFHIYAVMVKRTAKWQTFAIRPYSFLPTPGSAAADDEASATPTVTTK